MDRSKIKSFFFFAAIQSTIDLLAADDLTCKSYVVDISNRAEVYEAARKVKEDVGNVDILINNAGVVACKTLWDLPDKVIESTYAVNIMSHYWVDIFAFISLGHKVFQHLLPL